MDERPAAAHQEQAFDGRMPESETAGAGADPIGELETELERAKREWSRIVQQSIVQQNARLQGGLLSRWKGRTRKAQRTAAELERALSEYWQARRALEDACPEAGESGLPSESQNEAPKPRRLARPEPAGATRPSPRAPKTEPTVSLSKAGVDELREVGMSITQARRIIRYREQHGDFGAVEELDQVPGFPEKFLARIKDRMAP